MSDNCNCNTGKFIDLPIAGLSLKVDVSNLDCEPGDSGGFIRLPDYSFDEQWTGQYWVDGKKIYMKTIDCGILKRGSSQYNTNTPNMSRLISLKANGRSDTLGGFSEIPLVSTTTYNGNITISMYFNGTLNTICGTELPTDIHFYTTIMYTCTDR